MMRVCSWEAATVGILALTLSCFDCADCVTEAERFVGVTKGVSRAEVVNRVGQPTLILGPPLPDDFEGPCEGAIEASLYQNENKTTVVQFDERGLVVCVQFQMDLVHE